MGHFIGDEGEEVAYDLDLFVNHPLFLAELGQKRAQELCHRVRRFMPKLFEESMEIGTGGLDLALVEEADEAGRYSMTLAAIE